MKKRHWKRLGIALEILAVAAILIAIALPTLLDLNRYKGLIVAEIQKVVGGTVSLERLSWGIANGIWLKADGLSIADASVFPGDLWVSRIRAHLRLGPLLRKQIVLESLVLERPEVRLRLAPDRQEAAQPPGPTPAGAKPAGTPVPVQIERLAVQKGRLRLEDALSVPGQELVRVFHEVDIQAAPLIPGQAITFAVTLRDEAPLGLGPLQAHGTFSGLTPALGLDHPTLTLEASLASLHTEAVRPYLEGNPLAQRLSGSVSMTIGYEGDFISGQHRAQGMLDLGRLTYADPSLWDAELAGAGTTVGYRVRLDQETLTVEELALRRGGLSLTASGVVHDLAGRPVIRDAVLASEIECREVIPLIPWRLLGESAATLREALEDGGRVVIERATLPELSLAQPPAALVAVLPHLAATARVAGVSVPVSSSAPRFRNVSGSVRLAHGAAELEGLQGQFASVHLPTISARITGLTAHPRAEGTAKGELKIEAPTDHDVAALLRGLGLEAMSGVADVDFAFALDFARPEEVRLQGRVGLRNVTAEMLLSSAQLEGLSADVAITPDAAVVSNLSTTLAIPATGSAPAGRIALQAQGRIDGWRRRPAVTLRHLATSPMSLPVVASLVPWEKMGASARPLKNILQAGGTVKVEELALPRILLSSPQPLAQLLPRAKAVAAFADLAFQPRADIPPLESMTGRATLEGGVVTATNVRGAVGPWSLPDMTIRVARLEGPPTVSLTAKGLLQAAAAEDAKTKDLLKTFGLKSLTGSATIDVRADFDGRQADEWRTSGSVILAGVRAETFPHRVLIEELRGHVTVNRSTAIDLTAEEVTGHIDGAPVRLSGTLRGLGTPALAVEGSVYAKGLHLAHLPAFFPGLRPLGLAGTLDVDARISLPAAAAADARLYGRLTVAGVGFRLPAHGITVAGGDAELALRGAGAEILRMQLQVNDQLLAVTGGLVSPREPDIRLVVTSPELDLDRLLPPDNPTPATSSPPPTDSGPRQARSGKAELPAIARKLTAQLQVVAKQGQYRGLRFSDLTLGAAYERGHLPRWDLDFSIEGGRVRASGSADLRDPGRIPFVVRPHITSPQVELLAPVLGLAQAPATGPLSLTGDLHGQTGNTADLLASLRGTLAVRLGPGRYARIGWFGGAMAKILSFGSARGLLSGRLLGDLTGRGLSYQTITAEATFDAGSMDVGSFSFQSDAMSLAASGRVDLLAEQLDMRATLGVLGVVDRALQFVPILGQPTQALTSLHLRLTGPLDDPEVRIAVGEGTREAVTGGTQDIGTFLKGIGEFFKKGFRTLFGK